MSFETPTAPYNASDPNATFLSSSCFDFLLIELVPLAYETASATSSSPSITTHHRSGHSNLPNSNSNTNINNGDSISNGNSNGNSKPALDAKLSSAASGGGTTAGVGVSGSSIGAAVTPEDDAQRDIVSKRLDALGYRVGQGIVERYVFEFSLFLSVCVWIYTCGYGYAYICISCKGVGGERRDRIIQSAERGV